MKIDYSLPASSKYFGFLDAQYRLGYRHLYAAGANIFVRNCFNAQIGSKIEIVYHIAIGILELVPLFGTIIAIGEKFFLEKKLQIIELSGQDFYQMGLSHGQQLKKEIEYSLKVMKIYESIIRSRGVNPLKEAKKLEKFIPPEYIQEMQGIANGANIAYDEILKLNTLLDKIYGCSIIATHLDPATGAASKEIATNHYSSCERIICPNVDGSFGRFDTLSSQTPKNVQECKDALNSVNYFDSVQAIVLDCSKGEMDIAISGGYSANRSYTHFNKEELFSSPLTATDKTVLLARNLDWPGIVPQTVIYKRPKMGNKNASIIVGFAGMIGALSGMNCQNTPLALAISVVPSGGTQNGIPNSLLFRKVLDEAQNSSEAVRIVENNFPASAMNLVVAGRDGVCKMELDPDRKRKGHAHLEPAAPSSVASVA